MFFLKIVVFEVLLAFLSLNKQAFVPLLDSRDKVVEFGLCLRSQEAAVVVL